MLKNSINVYLDSSQDGFLDMTIARDHLGEFIITKIPGYEVYTRKYPTREDEINVYCSTLLGTFVFGKAVIRRLKL